MIEEEDTHVSCQRWTHWRSQCPISKESVTSEPRVAHYKHSTRPDLDAVYTFDRKIAQSRGLTLYQTRQQLCDYSVQHHTIGSINSKEFGDRIFSMQDRRKSQKSHANTDLLEQKKTQCSHLWNQLGENPTRPCMETTWRNQRVRIKTKP